ncbi:MAG TPA: hypothetical protein VIF15_06970 [Polyangiaceae bacterium]
MATPRSFLCVTIDCECDKGAAWRTRRPLAFDGVHVGIAGRLHPLFQRLGAKPTYLLSPELLRDASCVERLAALEGCELGAHLHGELAEPGAFEPDRTDAVQRDYPPEVERAKLAWLTGAFRSAFGRAPRSFRAGRFGVGPDTLTILEGLGYEVESSVTPHVDWSDVSAGLSFVGAPTQPYHPDPRDPARPGGSPLLEVPITIRPRALSRVPVLGKHIEPRWLRPTRTSGDELVAIARETIDDARRASPEAAVVLNAMFHNVEVVAGASPYAATDAQAQRIVDRLAVLLDFTRREGIACVGLEDVPGLLSR